MRDLRAHGPRGQARSRSCAAPNHYHFMDDVAVSTFRDEASATRSGRGDLASGLRRDHGQYAESQDEDDGRRAQSDAFDASDASRSRHFDATLRGDEAAARFLAGDLEPRRSSRGAAWRRKLHVAAPGRDVGAAPDHLEHPVGPWPRRSRATSRASCAPPARWPTSTCCACRRSRTTFPASRATTRATSSRSSRTFCRTTGR